MSDQIHTAYMIKWRKLIQCSLLDMVSQVLMLYNE